MTERTTSFADRAMEMAERMINPPVMIDAEQAGPPPAGGRYRADEPVRPEIERAARAICEAQGEPPDFLECAWQHWNDAHRRPCWKKYIEAAEAAEQVFTGSPTSRRSTDDA